MKTHTLLLLIMLSLAVSCEPFIKERGNGTIITEEREIDRFTKVDVGGAFKVEIYKASHPELKIITDENLMTYIDTYVEGETLYINTSETVVGSDGIRLHLGYNELKGLSISGAVSLSADDIVQSSFLDINMSGAGNLDVPLSVEALRVNISGAGSVELSGAADEQVVKMSGAGSYGAEKLKSRECRIKISGVGGAEVYVTEKLDAKVSGVGGIKYYGDPREVQSDVSGVGSIKRVGPTYDNI